MINREIYQKDPTQTALLNNGVAKIGELSSPEEIKTLHFELESFVCDGEYERGLQRILQSFLAQLSQTEQKAAWISGFFGSGKSHLAKMLCYLWVDYKFEADGATARSLAHLPSEIRDLFVELGTQGNRFGGLCAVAGTLGSGSMDNTRLALLQLVFRSVGLPEHYALAKIVLWLREKGWEAKVIAALKAQGTSFEKEITNPFASTALAQAILAQDSSFGQPNDVLAALRQQFPVNANVTIADVVATVREIFSKGGEMPLTLIVLDEVQQFIGQTNVQRAMDIQEIAEKFCSAFKGRVLLVGTGQQALTDTTILQRLIARFPVSVSLSDADVENVVRKVVLAKRADKLGELRQCLTKNQGEIDRHLKGTRLGPTSDDHKWQEADYPLLPVRRRLWEKVLRAVDTTGTAAQLRNQLTTVFEATRATAPKPLGSIVGADFIFDQLATQMRNTGALLPEFDTIIRRHRDGTPDGVLRSRLCAMIFLVGKLERTGPADVGLRATPEALVDLLVENLADDRTELLQRIPPLLDGLVAAGDLMKVGAEYSLQTREGAAWTDEFKRRVNQRVNDTGHLDSFRTDRLREKADELLKKVTLQQGASLTPRKLQVHYDATPPPPAGDAVQVWIRDDWTEAETTVRAEAQAEGTGSPRLFVFLPRKSANELKTAIASRMAAEETLAARGNPTSNEGVEARKSIESKLNDANNGEKGITAILGEVFADAKVFQGGGAETSGKPLAELVDEAAQSSLVRLFPQFGVADNAGWRTVFTRARSGAANALEAVGYNGNPEAHQVCAAIKTFIGAGRRGSDIRKQFGAAPFGWPQDAIDAALMALLTAGHLRATANGNPVNASALAQSSIGATDFRVEIPSLSANQRVGVRGLFQAAGLNAPSNEESSFAPRFLEKLEAMAKEAGGDPPLPARPDTKHLRDLGLQSGNAQLLALLGEQTRLKADIEAWQKSAADIAKRRPRWDTLQRLLQLAKGLPVQADVANQAAGIATHRSLLASPDPVAPLCKHLTAALRDALNTHQTELEDTYQQHRQAIEGSAVWAKLSEPQRNAILREHGLETPAKIQVGNEDEILATLNAAPLDTRKTAVEALSHRAAKAMEAAAKLIEPKATRLHLPSATIKDEPELDAWLGQVRTEAAAKLKTGPIIV
jgi:hypothetical protein